MFVGGDCSGFVVVVIGFTCWQRERNGEGTSVKWRYGDDEEEGEIENKMNRKLSCIWVWCEK